MRSLIIVCCLLAAVLAACSDDSVERSNLADPKDAGADLSTIVDTGVDAAESPVPDAAPDSEQCVCSSPSACCDGCQAINQGEACDDGLECTRDATCQPDGACGAPSGSVCDAQLSEPQCQSIACDEVAGCGTVQDIREGFACDDGDDGTYDDTCQEGACVGAPCACDVESACCDGCNIIAADGVACGNGDDDADRYTCQQGQCVGEVCECAPGDSCCDGCHWTPGAVCERFTRLSCQGECGGRVATEEQVFTCVLGETGRGYHCQTVDQPWRVIETEQCGRFERCTSGDGSAVCTQDYYCD